MAFFLTNSIETVFYLYTVTVETCQNIEPVEKKSNAGKRIKFEFIVII